MMQNKPDNNSIATSADLEKELIQRVKQKDKYAFTMLVDNYKERVVRMAYSVTGNLNDAQDIAQDAFIKVFKHINNFRSESRFSTWLYRIVVNICRDFLRSKKRFRLIFQEQAADSDVYRFAPDRKSKDPAGELMNKELKDKIDRELKSLSEKQQIAFTLKYRHGLKSEEIAQIMDLNVSTVKVHIFRAANNLQKKLSPYLGGGN